MRTKIKTKIRAEENKMKDKYISPECEIIRFDAEDVITTSGLKANSIELEEDEIAVFSKEKFNQ